MNKNRKKLEVYYNNWFEYFKDSIGEDHLEHKIIFVSDCDGILTDGRSYFNDVKTHKSYGSYDKEAVKFICDYIDDVIYFVSDDKIGSKITENRINHMKKSTNNKQVYFMVQSPQERYELVKYLKTPNNIVVFIGDSLSDIPALSAADIAMTTNNAAPQVKEYCNYVSSLNGGMGGFADCIFHFYENLKDVKSILKI